MEDGPRKTVYNRFSRGFACWNLWPAPPDNTADCGMAEEWVSLIPGSAGNMAGGLSRY